jgi:hypothetical protein
VSSIATTGIERKNDMLSYSVGECRVILKDHHDLTVYGASHSKELNGFWHLTNPYKY